MADGYAAGRRIIVGLDGSRCSVLALRWGAWLARASSAKLIAVMGWEYPIVYGWSSGYDRWNPEADARLVIGRTLEEVFGSNPPEYVSSAARRGRPASVLIDLSRDAEAVVVGSRGHGGFAGMLLGSVSSAVAEHSACPVLVVHGDRPPPESDAHRRSAHADIASTTANGQQRPRTAPQ